MVILYISNLTGNQFAGPNYSVPNQIAAQAKLDEVFWINLNNNTMPQDRALLCRKISEVGDNIPEDLPKPFNNPDVVVFEEFYCYAFNTIVRQIIDKGIPYIIVPRSQLTKQAKSMKKLKKYVADILFFNKFLRGSTAIQFLTSKEMIESVCAKRIQGIVIPNGVTMPVKESCARMSSEKLVVSYIGRLEKQQKGLDLLLEACSGMKEVLLGAKVEIHLYGNSQGDTKEYIANFISRNELDNLFKLHDAAFDDEKKQILQSSSLFIMTSRFEGMPMGLIEALSYGLPCVVTEGTNLADAIREYEAGWTAKNEVGDIKRALYAMLDEKDTIEDKRNNALKLAKTFSWESIAHETHSKYSKILGRK